MFLTSNFPARDDTVTVVSYNIKHGEGNDGKIDIERGAKLIQSLQPDIVALQEVDHKATRSGGIDQAKEYGRLTSMNSAFGSFMDFQGGKYGMAILTRHLIQDSKSIQLPTGNEPRISLMASLKLDSGTDVKVFNVHFDWVDDDKYRFDQANVLVEHLKTVSEPFIVLGDFNDEPGSRTIDLFRKLCKEAGKNSYDRFTFSSTKPEKEIDFIFVWPPQRWEVQSVKVIDEPIISDHRPVVATLKLVPHD